VHTTTSPSNLLEAFELNLLLPQVLNLGDYYHVDFGEGVSPRRHQVYHLQTSGLVCVCESGKDCPAVVYVQQYMIQVGSYSAANLGLAEDQASDPTSPVARVHPEEYLLRFIPHACPQCGSQVKPDHRLDGYTEKGLIYAGWTCMSGGAKCFLRYKMARSLPAILAVRQKNPDPYLIPPTNDGYPGIRLSKFGQPRREVDTETTLWYQAARCVLLNSSEGSRA
jgi:hypothetical protein